MCHKTEKPNQIFLSIELLLLDSNTWNYLTMCKQMISGLFKNVSYKLFIYKLYI